MIEKENVQGYINYESGIPKATGLWSSLLTIIIIGVPTALFGACSDLTKIVMLPLIIVLCLWIVYLSINTDTKLLQYIFFLGVMSVFVSLSYLIAAYKIANMTMKVPISYVILTAVVYLITNTLSILYTLRLIKKGYFKVTRKNENPMGLIAAAGVFGLSIARLAFGNAGQDTAIAFGVILLIFLGFLFSIGTHNFVKYYFAKKFQKNDQLIDSNNKSTPPN